MGDSSDEAQKQVLETEQCDSAADETTPPPKASRSRTLDLARHTIEQNLWILAGPLIAERLLQSVVDAADMAMVGRVGAASVAAVGLSNQISMIATSFFDAIRVGTTSVVARRIGAGQSDEAQEALRQSLLVAAAIGIIAFILLSAGAGTSLRLMGADDDVVSQGIGYFWWKGMSLFFEFITMTFAAALRGAGNTRLPMYVGTVVNIVNVCGNYVLIGGNFGFPQMGAAGAGLATAFARLCGMVVTIILTTSVKNPLSDWFKGSFKPNKEALAPVLRIGMPASGERLVLRCAQILYTRAISGLGTNAYAAHQIALRIESITLTIGFSFGAATTTLVGQYLGFGDHHKAEQSAIKARKLAAIAMGVGGVLLFFGAPFVIHLFILDNPEVTHMGATVLRIIAAALPFMGINHVMSGGLRGAGDTAWVMYITGVSSWCIRVVFTYILAVYMNLGLPGAWYAMSADLIVRSLLFRWRFHTGKWKEITV